MQRRQSRKAEKRSGKAEKQLWWVGERCFSQKEVGKSINEGNSNWKFAIAEARRGRNKQTISQYCNQSSVFLYVAFGFVNLSIWSEATMVIGFIVLRY